MKGVQTGTMHVSICDYIFAGGIKKLGITQANLPADPQRQISEWGTCPA